MNTLTFDFPHEISNHCEKEIKIAIATILFDQSQFTSQEAARFAGISKHDFLVVMGDYAHFYSQVLNGIRKKLTMA